MVDTDIFVKAKKEMLLYDEKTLFVKTTMNFKRQF